MQSVFFARYRQAAAFAAALIVLSVAMPAAAIDLFARHRVTVQFATGEGKPMADAEVRVFAPGQPGRPALTGRTDSTGKFEFPANEDGMWSAEAHAGGEIARVMVRVGNGAGSSSDKEPLSPFWLLAGLLLLLVLAFAFRALRARNRRHLGGPPA